MLALWWERWVGLKQCMCVLFIHSFAITAPSALGIAWGRLWNTINSNLSACSNMEIYMYLRQWNHTDYFFKHFDSAKSFLVLCKYFLRWKIFASTSAWHSAGGVATRLSRNSKTYSGAGKFTALHLYQLTGFNCNVGNTSLLVLINGGATGHGLTLQEVVNKPSTKAAKPSLLSPWLHKAHIRRRWEAPCSRQETVMMSTWSDKSGGIVMFYCAAVVETQRHVCL